MEKFVLTVLRDNVLDACEVFEDQSSALNSGIYFCEMSNIDVNRYPNYDEKMKGWLVSDSHGYFVSVVRRPAHLTSYMIGSSYGAFLDALAGRGFTRRGGGYGTISYAAPGVQLTGLPPPATPVVMVPLPPVPAYAPGDNPNDDDLPGGFSAADKPVDIATLRNDPHYVKAVHQLTDEQKWALVLARTKHRPKQVIVINSLGCLVKGCWSQYYMLQELTKRTTLGLEMRDQELKELDEIHAAALYAYDDEESSSSSEEEDYD